ncbi:MAG: ABC transporter permease [Firmicutes bacterium]|nr:ABC transporter permease [Bacillota bacterium]
MAPNVPCCQKSGRDTELPSDLEEGDAVAALESALTYLAANADRFWKALGIHLELAAASLAVAAAVCIPLGIWAARSPAAGNWAMNVIEALRVVPSLAVLILVFPYLGFGARTAMVALSILASPPILVNTYVAYRNIDPAVLEAAVGMGMTPGQILRWIETPLAAPVVMAGIRTAASEVVASATLAAFIGGGGLGEFIVNGLAMNNVGLLLVGGIPVALLALLAEGLLSIPEYVVRRRIR